MPASRRKRGLLLLTLAGLIVLGGMSAFLASSIKELDSQIRERFSGQLWALPAIVYARPLEVYPGKKLQTDELEAELLLAGYRHEEHPSAPGGYSRQGDRFSIISREFTYPSGLEPSLAFTLQIAGGKVSQLQAMGNQQPLSLLRLDPARIGSFHPKENRDRIVLSRQEIPQLLIDCLLAVEDRQFYSHSGLSFLAILRAAIANLRAGQAVQGGSTLTQQLVKNFFLNREKTLSRKFQEAVMSILLELRFSKDEILTAYINEIFLGQDRARAIHGFGLASQYYFRKSIADLSPAQTATLVGMVKGPSSYDPRRNPEKSLARRNQVLGILRESSLLTETEYLENLASPLLATSPQLSGFNRYPAFLDLVRRQLLEQYQPEDLASQGLRILTNLDPQVQNKAEEQLAATIKVLEQRKKTEHIEGAVIITARETGEILALVGGRDGRAHGFNRALDARRQIGSLIKPAVYLTAIEAGYQLDSQLSDTAVSITDQQGKAWQPANYDRLEHGQVPLYEALAHSYNLATVNLGMTLGLERVIEVSNRLGLKGPIQSYPSLLLGAHEASPLEIAQLYQTLAAGGFFVPQRAISAVLSISGETLESFGLEIEQRFTPESIFLLNYAMQLAVAQGTGHSLATYFHDQLAIAGKTGTTDDLRDSWFAGFSGDLLAVVWLGRDDNKPTGLTGSTGAMAAWARIVRELSPQPLGLAEPTTVGWQRDERGISLPYLMHRSTNDDGEHAGYPSVRKTSLLEKLSRIFE